MKEKVAFIALFTLLLPGFLCSMEDCNRSPKDSYQKCTQDMQFCVDQEFLIKNGQPIKLIPNKDLVAIGYQKSVQLYSTRNGKKIGEIKDDPFFVEGMAVDSKGEKLAIAWSPYARLYNVETQETFDNYYAYPKNYTGVNPPEKVYFSPDERQVWLAFKERVGDTSDKLGLEKYDASTGEHIGSSQRYYEALSPDRKTGIFRNKSNVLKIDPVTDSIKERIFCEPSKKLLLGNRTIFSYATTRNSPKKHLSPLLDPTECYCLFPQFLKFFYCETIKEAKQFCINDNNFVLGVDIDETRLTALLVLKKRDCFQILMVKLWNNYSSDLMQEEKE